jgi:FMN phosphatase YigB (HAD superfamily)
VTVVLLDLYQTLVEMDSPAVAAGRRRGAELAGADPDCLLQGWSGTIDARSLGRMGAPRDELRRLLAACGAAAGGARLDELIGVEAETWRSGVRLYEDVLPALDRLRRGGRRLSIVSNCSWQTRGVLEATGLDRAVDLAVLSYEVGLMKPDPAILRLALERLGAGPAEAVLVDDVTAHLDSAQALGMRTVLMDRGRSADRTAHPSAADLRAAEALL